MSKDQWIADQEAIVERFVAEDLDHGEAVALLVELGFDADEAADLLDIS